jgi:ASC-1-like (ASCH) protein
MTRYTLNLGKKKYFKQILNGTKKFEGRMATEKYLNMQIGDELQIILPKSKIYALFRIKSIDKYSGFRELLMAKGFRNLIPDAKNLDEAVNVYHQIYKPADVAKYGCVAIELELIQGSTKL